jgi:hypothetical protein
LDKRHLQASRLSLAEALRLHKAANNRAVKAPTASKPRFLIRIE